MYRYSRGYAGRFTQRPSDTTAPRRRYIREKFKRIVKKRVLPQARMYARRNQRYTGRNGPQRQPYGYTMVNKDIAPDKLHVVLPYWDVLLFTGQGVVDYSEMVFNLNSVFDPEYALGGHSPRGFNTWNKIYKTYHVTRTDIEGFIYPADITSTVTNTDSVNYMVGYQAGINGVAGMVQDVREMMELPKDPLMTRGYLSRNSVKTATTNPGHWKFKRSFTERQIRKLVGSQNVAGTPYNNADYSAAVTNNPVALHQIVFFVASIPEAGATLPISKLYISLKLRYHVTFSQVREDLADTDQVNNEASVAFRPGDGPTGYVMQSATNKLFGETGATGWQQ